ncbi:MAG: hypothetical protein ACKN97_05625 [Acidobacteriota bacterium]
MKKALLTFTIIMMGAVIASAQNFSGKWVFDLSKSKPDERSRIAEQTITVNHTGTDFTRETISKRTPPPGRGQGMGGRGGFGGGDGTENLKLDGKEITVQVESPMGPQPMSKKAELKNGTLYITSTRTMNSQMGEIKLITREEWSMSADGKTLTIKNAVETPRGTMTSEMVYNKN